MATRTRMQVESCGCAFEVERYDLDDWQERIVFCPLHREAEALVAFVRRIVAHARHGADLTARDYQEARALLRRVV